MRSILAISILSAFTGVSAHAQEKPWTGKTVVTKKAGIKVDFTDDTAPLLDGWKEFVNKAGGYAVAMPGTPEQRTWDVPTKGGKVAVILNGIYLKMPARAFGVGYSDSLDKADYSDALVAHKEIDRVLTGMVAESNGKVKKKSITRFEAYPAEEWWIELATGEKQIYLAFQAGPRMYQLLAAWAPTYDDGAKEAEFFFQSFRLLNSPRPARGTGTLDEIQFRVLADSKGRLRVVTPSGPGWIDKADAIPVEEAVAYFTDYLRMNPKDARAYHVRGLVQKLEGKLDLAVKDYTKSLDLEAQASVHNNRGVAYFNLREYKKAVADFSAAINENLDLLPAFYGRGVAYNELKDYDAAIADFNNLIARDPKNVAAYNGRGDALRGSGEYAKAIADYTAALRLDKNQPFVYNNRGLAHFLKKDYEEALVDFALSQALDPKNAWVYKNRARLYATSANAKYRDGKKAIEQAKTAMVLERNPDGDFHETLAAAYAEAGDFPQAIREQETAVQMLDDDESRARLEQFKKKQPYRQK